MRGQTQALKEAVADLTLENRLLKKSMIGDGDYQHLGGVLIAHVQLLTRHRRTKRNIPMTGKSPIASIQHQNCPICKWLDLSMCRQAQRVWRCFFHAHKKKPHRLVTCAAGESPKVGAMNLRIDISENIKVVNQLWASNFSTKYIFSYALKRSRLSSCPCYLCFVNFEAKCNQSINQPLVFI